MATKLIVHGLKENMGFINPTGKVNVLIDKKTIGIVEGKDTKEFIVTSGKFLACSARTFFAGKGIEIQDNTTMEISCIRASSTIEIELVSCSAYQDLTPIENEPEETIFSIKGARGRHLKVYEDRVVITTSVTFGSLLSGNATDGEKTIYYVDCIGVQYKPSGVTLGYIQLETASATMNNKGSNHFNENSFTYDGNAPETDNVSMRKVADYIQDKIREIKQAKPISTAVTNAVSSADELKKFKDLLDIGAITQDEFNAKKKQLLGL